MLPTPPVSYLLRVHRRAGAPVLVSLRRLHRWSLYQWARIARRQRAVPPLTDGNLLPYASFLGWSRTYRGLLTSHCTALSPATHAMVFPSLLVDRQSQPQQISRAP